MQKNAFSKKFMAGGAVLLSLSAAQVAQAQFTLNLTADAGSVTTTGGSGTTVTAWNDSGSANADLTGSGGANSPVWSSGVVNGSSSSGYLSFTGSEADVLAATGVIASSLFSANQVAISMVIRPGVGNSADALFSWASGGTYVQLAENDDAFTPGFAFVHNTAFYQASEPSGWEGNWSILTVVRNGNYGELRRDGAIFASSATAFQGAGDLNTSLSGTLQVGQTVGAPTQSWTGDIAAIRVSTDVNSVGSTEAALGGAYNLAPVPEPSQYATVFSLICVAGALVYRQRRQRALAS